MNDWSDAERRVEKAQQFFEQRKWSEALREIRLATSINPYNSTWFFNMGLILDELGRFEEALEAYRQADGIDSNEVKTLYHMGLDLYRTGRHRQIHRNLRPDRKDRPILRAVLLQPHYRLCPAGRARAGRGNVLYRPALQGELPPLLLQHGLQPGCPGAVRPGDLLLAAVAGPSGRRRGMFIFALGMPTRKRATASRRAGTCSPICA